jgi:hypothetical protein
VIEVSVAIKLLHHQDHDFVYDPDGLRVIGQWKLPASGRLGDFDHTQHLMNLVGGCVKVYKECGLASEFTSPERAAQEKS